jgi:regulator of RNase E activity RraA
VEAFGRKIKPGQLIHADKHGFMVIPEEDEPKLLEAARFMDSNECNTVIPACRYSYGKPLQEISDEFGAAAKKFGENVKAKFKGQGEW